MDYESEYREILKRDKMMSDIPRLRDESEESIRRFKLDII